MDDRDLENEARRATEHLQGKVVRVIWRHRTNEVGIEFEDGTRIFVDGHSNGDIELSITGGTSCDEE